MISPMSSSRMPQCLTCVRRATNSFMDTWLAPTRQQVRGKKKLAKISTINIRLLKDIPRYGRQGSVISIAPGRMRNEFYPKRLAEYMTTAKLRNVGMHGAVFDRDSTFGHVQLQTSPEEPKAQESPSVIDIELPKPESAMKLMSTLLPPNIDFYRTPINSTLSNTHRRSPSLPITSELSTAAKEVLPPETRQKSSIYGSVTTADIAENLKAILAEDDEGVRVALTPEDITFVETGEEKDRVKHLGIFEIDIRIKGAPDVIRRTIKVNAQESL